MPSLVQEKPMNRSLILLLMAFAFSWSSVSKAATTSASVECEGRFVNPITDVCWE
ncbi:TPA: conjugal transfer protein TraU, partial [Escherichia coli]|nr:conjugal transfer protein TraU [Escherichia coli]